jgi:large subunit ribosomal protein L35
VEFIIERGLFIMPKIKTHRGAAKRFSLTKNGKVKRGHAKRRHILNKKTTKLKRHLRKAAYACDANANVIKKLIPYK